MKKAGIPEYIAKKYFYTKGKRDNYSPCSCLTYSFFVTSYQDNILPLPGSVQSLIAEQKIKKTGIIFSSFHSGNNSTLTYCTQTAKTPATGFSLSTNHVLVQSSEIIDYSLTNAVNT